MQKPKKLIRNLSIGVIFLLSISILSVFSTVKCDAGNLYIHVTYNGNPVNNAHVVLLDTNFDGYTNSLGYVLFTEVPENYFTAIWLNGTNQYSVGFNYTGQETVIHLNVPPTYGNLYIHVTYNGNPVNNAHVVLLDTNFDGYTNSSGYVLFTEVPENYFTAISLNTTNYSVGFQYDGQETYISLNAPTPTPTPTPQPTATPAPTPTTDGNLYIQVKYNGVAYANAHIILLDTIFDGYTNSSGWVLFQAVPVNFYTAIWLNQGYSTSFQYNGQQAIVYLNALTPTQAPTPTHFKELNKPTDNLNTLTWLSDLTLGNVFFWIIVLIVAIVCGVLFLKSKKH
jgi:hypothetical protein